MDIPYLPITPDGMVTHILSCQGQSQKTLSKSKIMAAEFWNWRGVFLLDLMPQETGAYCAILRKLRKALQNRLRDMLSKGVLLLHDNARPLPPRTTRELIQSFGWEVLNHAPYSPDLAPREFHLFQYLIYSLGGKPFSDNEEMKAAVNSWLSN
ncbi:uncharacterized protein TNCV_3556151 [Trichonephila clavipes]|nr:uncharacterized protein TNCV_3556151 [Trichonephila clavipes]